MAVFIIVTFYMLQLNPLFTNFLIENIKDFRNKKQISKLHSSETKELTIAFWNTLTEKKEFKINGIYYDVLSYKKKNNKVIAKVVKDSYEEYFKIALDDIFGKKENSQKDKKKVQKLNLQITALSSPSESLDASKTKFYYRSNYRELKGKTKKISITTLRPPC